MATGLCPQTELADRINRAYDAFDYGDLEKPVVKSLESHAKAIVATQQQVRRTTAEGVLRLGEHLKAVHDLLAGKNRYGLFRPWVKQRCGFTEMSARRAINAYEVFGSKSNKVLLLDVSAMYLLSAESCPEEATEEAIKLAESGQPVTHKLAKEIKAKYAEPESATHRLRREYAESTDKLRAMILRTVEHWPEDTRYVIPALLRSIACELDAEFEQPPEPELDTEPALEPVVASAISATTAAPTTTGEFATVTLRGRVFEVKQRGAMWFYRTDPSSGWTSAGEVMGAAIEEQLQAISA